MGRLLEWTVVEPFTEVGLSPRWVDLKREREESERSWVLCIFDCSRVAINVVSKKLMICFQNRVYTYIKKLLGA